MLIRTVVLFVALGFAGHVQAQDDSTSKLAVETPVSEFAEEKPEAPAEKTRNADRLKKTAGQWEARTTDEVTKIAKQVDRDPRAKSAAAGILQPIYLVAERLAFPAFHWLAFSLMAAGVVSYTLQIALGKLVVLTRMGFSIKEIASDAIGLAISVVGLVLTTQAAAENSTFTQSPAAVISATVVGAFVGIILYLWGQSQELEAVAGRSQPKRLFKK